MESTSEKLARLVQEIDQAINLYSSASFINNKNTMYSGKPTLNLKEIISDENKLRAQNLLLNLNLVKNISRQQRAYYEAKEENEKAQEILNALDEKLSGILQRLYSLIDKSNWAEILSKLPAHEAEVLAPLLRKEVSVEIPKAKEALNIENILSNTWEDDR